MTARQSKLVLVLNKVLSGRFQPARQYLLILAALLPANVICFDIDHKHKAADSSQDNKHKDGDISKEQLAPDIVLCDTEEYRKKMGRWSLDVVKSINDRIFWAVSEFTRLARVPFDITITSMKKSLQPEEEEHYGTSFGKLVMVNARRSMNMYETMIDTDKVDTDLADDPWSTLAQEDHPCCCCCCLL